MVPFYSTIAPFVDKAGKILQPFLAYLQQFTIQPPPFSDITVGSSPFEYHAAEPGNIYISGGVVSAISLTRGTTILSLVTTRPIIIPVGIEDSVTVTYTGLPTMKFIASYGSNTNQ